MHVDSCLFDGISDLLIALKRISIQWGIVTNKPGKLTEPLIRALNLIECAHNTEINSAACVISGDTTPHAKPHPEPLLEAARRLSILPEQCWYLGDDLRDIQAGKAAGMATLAVTWGYGELEKIPDWQADVTLDHPHQLLDLLS